MQTDTLKKNNGVKYLVFSSKDKNKKELERTLGRN